MTIQYVTKHNFLNDYINTPTNDFTEILINNKHMGSKEWTLGHPVAIQNNHYYYKHSIYSVSGPTRTDAFFIYYNNNNIIILLPIWPFCNTRQKYNIIIYVLVYYYYYYYY